MINKKIAVIGGGSWGSALACVFARITGHTLIYTRNSVVVDEINNHHTNRKYLQDTLIDENVQATTNFADTLNYDVIIVAIPSHHFSTIIDNFKKQKLNPKTSLLIASKGMCDNPLQLFSDKISESLDNDFAFIYGPNFAKEVAEGKKASITIATKNSSLEQQMRSMLCHDQLIAQFTKDIITVQIASMAKNIFAIKGGIMQARGDGENIRAYLISQALTEISSLAVHLGGEYKSLSLASVVGDLVLTCGSQTSRNTRFGYDFYQHNYSKEFLENYPVLVEGVQSACLLNKLAASFGLRLNVVEEIAGLVSN